MLQSQVVVFLNSPTCNEGVRRQYVAKQCHLLGDHLHLHSGATRRWSAHDLTVSWVFFILTQRLVQFLGTPLELKVCDGESVRTESMRERNKKLKHFIQQQEVKMFPLMWLIRPFWDNGTFQLISCPGCITRKSNLVKLCLHPGNMLISFCHPQCSAFCSLLFH